MRNGHLREVVVHNAWLDCTMIFLHHKKNARPGLTVWVVKFVNGFIALHSVVLWPERVLSVMVQ